MHSSMLVFLMVVALAVVGAANAAVVDVTSSSNDVVNGNKTNATSFIWDGIDVNVLTDDELLALADAEDEKLSGYMDVWSGVEELKRQKATRRPKRVLPILARLAFQAARGLFSSSARGALSRSGPRLTRQYTNPGNFQDAVRHFNNARPTNVRPIGNGKGFTGTLGNHRVTVRNTSSNGQPTLEIRSPTSRSGADTYVRKFRFQGE